MIMQSFLGVIIILIGAVFVLVAGGCTVLGIISIYHDLSRGHFHGVVELIPIGLTTLAVLGAGVLLIFWGIHFCKKDDSDTER